MKGIKCVYALSWKLFPSAIKKSRYASDPLNILSSVDAGKSVTDFFVACLFFQFFKVFKIKTVLLLIQTFLFTVS